MTNVAIFPEKRTRSQLTLPDDILQIPPGSPMKDARSALRNHIVTPDACSSSEPKQPSDDTDDELLLSPGKKAPLMRAMSNSKRSASPPPQDEYIPPSGTPEGRLLKRAKRELGPSEGTEGDAVNLKASQSLPEILTPGNTRNRSDPTVPATARRSARKRSATKNKKPISTLSASPPPTTFSPIFNSPKIGRAQSVPLFPTSHDIPHIDFRNPPPSPTRSRSRSRSPSKVKEAKLRTLFTSFPSSKTLPTIHDEIPTTPMDMDDEASSLHKEIEMETPSASEASIEPQITPTVIEPTSLTPPTPPSTSTFTLHEIPATPVSRSLNTLIPMSPLTPLPETPLPPRLMSNAENRYTGNLGWGLPPTEETAEPSRAPLFPPTVESSTLKSRLPRPATSMAPPPAPSFRMSRPGGMGPPPAASTKAGPSSHATMATTSKKVPVTAARKDAFAMLMKKPREEKERLEKEKAKQRATKTMAPTNIFASISKAKEPLTSGTMQSKMKMKDKMRPKMKPKQEKAPLPAPISDEEEEAASESERPSVPDLVPVILPEDRPLTPTRIGRPRSLPDDAGMEIVEDSEGEGQATEQAPIDTAIIADTEHVSIEDVEIPSASIVEAPTELSSHTTMADAEHISNDDVDIPSEAVAEVPRTELSSLVPETDTTNEHIELTEDTSASDLAQEGSEQQKEDEGQTDIRPSSWAKASKLPLGKKRQPTTVVPGSRVTRSISNSKRKDNDAEASTSTAPRAKPKPTSTIPAKRTVSKVVKKPVEADETSKASSSHVVQEKTVLPPGSPMRLSSPGKALKPITPKKTPGRFTFSTKPASSPSPTKIVRSSSLFSVKTSSFTAARTFSMAPSQVAMGAGSSLSTLSNALEKLRMPAPSRPSTSMGFNRDAPGSDDGELSRTKDDTGVGRTSFGMGRPEGLKRANTLSADVFKVPAVNAAASSSKAGSSIGKNLVQKPLSMFMSSKGAAAKAGASNFLRGTGRTSMMRNKPLFGVGGGPRRTISKKTTLPMVVGSPVKGGGSSQMVQEEDEDEHADEVRTQVGEETGDVFMTSETRSESTFLLEDLPTTTAESSEKGKGKEKEKDFRNVSRRVSMISHALSQSLNAVPPPPPARGLMGPPATPPHAGRSPKRSASSSYPSTSAGGSSPSQPGTATGTRASARIAKTAPLLAKVRTDGLGKKAAPEAAPVPNPAVEALKVLRDCVIFVDVKTDTGEEAGSLFVEMLEGVGARVLTRVGQTCTHIVYKNGLMSTLTRYRLLRDPKPLVVGIAWVVECVEQRRRVDEAEFLVDLEGANIAGINKRRRSMLPKSFAHDFEAPSSEGDKDEDGDHSMDGSTSSVTPDDDLAPLERARRRKSIMIGLRP